MTRYLLDTNIISNVVEPQPSGIDVVHSFSSYDIVVDTGRTQVDTCVSQILARLPSA
ncbi:MAG: hypothetical protein IT537_17535 [Hyphomicrobiales bacterium]|nr:hypothetical protein [Hyphomicrobiales bacterium]